MGTTTKNQITSNGAAEGGQSFADFDSARKPMSTEYMNQMPIGYDACPDDEFVEGYGGDTDVSGGITASSLEAGYKKKQMLTNYDAQADAMAQSDMVEVNGFATPRNNYYDRM